MTIVSIRGSSREERAELTCKLLGELKARDLRVSVVANAGATAEIDIPGKDSFEHRRAGAREVLAVSRLRWALVHEVAQPENDDRFSMDYLLSRLNPADIVLAPNCTEQANITLNLSTDGSLQALPQGSSAITFRLDSPEQIAEFITNVAAEKSPIS